MNGKQYHINKALEPTVEKQPLTYTDRQANHIARGGFTIGCAVGLLAGFFLGMFVLQFILMS